MYTIIKIPLVIDVDSKLSDQLLHLTKSGTFDGSSVWQCATVEEANHMLAKINDSNCVITIY